MVPCAAFLLAVLVVPRVVRAGDEVSIAVMEMTGKGGVTQGQMDALGDLLTTEVKALCQCRVIGKSDIRAALQLEEQKTLLGCSDDSCMAEIGGALGVRWLAVGNVSKFGESYLLNLRMIDVAHVKLAASVSVKVEGGQEQLIDVLGQSVRELLIQAKPKMFLDGGPDLTRESGLLVVGQRPMSLSGWGHVAFWSGLGLAAFGGVSAGMLADSRSDYMGGDWDADGSISTWTGLTFVGFGAGVALMGAGALLWLLHGEDAGPTGDDGLSAGVSVQGRGVGLIVGGRW